MSKKRKTTKECFVIMPFSDQPGYPQDHFTKVYVDIICNACAKAKINPVRGDSTNEANVIHVDIVKRLIMSELAICDVSSRNPNVMFELGIRQAYGLPTVLISDTETPRIFDVNPIRCVFYESALEYRSVLDAQDKIADAIRDTLESKNPGASSIVSLAKVQLANRPEFKIAPKSEKRLDALLDRFVGIEDRLKNIEHMCSGRRWAAVPGVSSVRDSNVCWSLRA